MSKTLLLILILIIVAVGLYLGFGNKFLPKPPKYTGPVEKVTLGKVNAEDSALILVAQDKGFFAENGLEVTLKDYQSGGAGIKDLMTG